MAQLQPKRSIASFPDVKNETHAQTFEVRLNLKRLLRLKCLTRSIRFSTRPDVLVYETRSLKQDLAIGAPLRATLHVSTKGIDVPWVVNLMKVSAGDYAGK